MFRYQAWIFLGKVANPVTREIERDLVAARSAIDLLSELEAKTEGHRSPEESKILAGTLTELRLNYLDEAKKPEPDSPEAGTGPAGDDAPADG
jgi:hypothetical protein